MLHGVLIYNVYRVFTGTQEQCPKHGFCVNPRKLAVFLGVIVGVAALKENRTNRQTRTHLAFQT
jgi:hypothetical protein